MTDALQQTYQTCVERFLKKYRSSSHTPNTLFVFQGFPLPFYVALEAAGVAHFSGAWDRTYPSMQKLHDNTQILLSFLQSSGMQWCFYEELISLTKTLNDFAAYKGTMLVVRNDLFNAYYPIPLENPIEVIRAIDNESVHKDSEILTYYSDYQKESDHLYFAFVNRHFAIDLNREVKLLDFFDEISVGYTEKKSQAETECLDIKQLRRICTLLQEGTVHDRTFSVSVENNKENRKLLRKLNAVATFFDVHFIFSDTLESIKETAENQYLDVLQKYWGAEAHFRPNIMYVNPDISNETVTISQGTIISDILEQCRATLKSTENQYSDLIVTAPTGAGKSVLFQVPGIYLHEHFSDPPVTIVICPLVALMIDQVKELNERGISYATYINSSITFEERQSRLEGIKQGLFSIVYLSPELLLSYDIRSLIGERRIGLLVIDEAHLVTSWGRDFRVDYWFLGDYIERMRRGSVQAKVQGRPFPVLCLTATAANGGRDDVIGDLEKSLHLTVGSGHKYLGYVRRDNIHFTIRLPKRQFRSDKEDKIRLTADAIHSFVEHQEKSIVYFPFISQIDDLRLYIQNTYSGDLSKIEVYHAKEGSMEKDDAYSRFRDNEVNVMLATKAFGMGVNISDILNVYHFAPTGTLADYVQEIGRAARKLEKGYAIIDYLPSDMHYAQTLWGLSGLRHYQIKAIMKKLYELYMEKKRRNLLFSPETFSFLFDSESVDIKVKSGLMLLSNDLLETYHFKVITVRARNLFSQQYALVPESIENDFMKKYGKYCRIVNDCLPYIEYGGLHSSDVKCSKSGNVYEINLDEIWETKFTDITFAQFKYKFFNGELFDYPEKIAPNIKLVINYHAGYEETKSKFTALATAISDSFKQLKQQFGGKEFTIDDFSKIFKSHYAYPIRREYVLMLLDLFCYDHTDGNLDAPRANWKFVQRQKRKKAGFEGLTYCIRTNKYAYISSNLLKYYKQAKPNKDEHTFVIYIPINQQHNTQLTAAILQMFDLASYEFVGGKNPQIFVRINDPIKLRRLSESSKEYKNSILTDISSRHKRAVRLMNHFMHTAYSDEQRWEIIENYFLGNDDFIDACITSEPESPQTAPPADTPVQFPSNLISDVSDGDILSEFYESWTEAQEAGLPLCGLFAESHLPLADYVNAKLKVSGKVIALQYVWERQKVVTLESPIDSKTLDVLRSSGWLCFDEQTVDLDTIKNRLCGEC